jgi:transposase
MNPGLLLLEQFHGFVNRLGVSPARGYVIHLLHGMQKVVSMGKPYSDDLRERIVGAVAAGESRRAAARKFGVSASCAVKLLQRWETTGSVRPDRQGVPNRCKLDAHAAWLLDVVEEGPDITLSEIQARLLGERGMTASIGAIWTFFDRRNISFKKKPRTPLSERAPTWPLPVMSNTLGRFTSIRLRWFSSTKPGSKPP